MYEYLPAFLGQEVDKYNGYKSDIHPGISHVFQSAAFRYGTLHRLRPSRFQSTKSQIRSAGRYFAKILFRVRSVVGWLEKKCVLGSDYAVDVAAHD